MSVLVVGDIILDRYTLGTACRISPEAPVPVLHVTRREERLGGAASVAGMVRGLGARVRVAGVVGDDDSGADIRGLLARQGIAGNAVLTDPGRRTTVKERIIGLADGRHAQQLIRLDAEDQTAVRAEVEKRLVSGIRDLTREADVVLVSDYSKGVCTSAVLREVIECTTVERVPLLVDPGRASRAPDYAGCSCLTPNRAEARALTGMDSGTPGEALEVAERLRQLTGAEAVIVTLDKDGMALAHRDGRRRHFPTRSRQVYDVTGAGDMVLCVLGLARAAGYDYEAAIELANLAAGLEVERFGATAINLNELAREARGAALADPDKAMTRGEAAAAVARARECGKRVVFTNGCFDVLHPGHVRLLDRAKACGDLLVVGLNGDGSVRRLKGEGRPLNPAVARAAVLHGLAAVDHVVVFEEDHPLELIRALRPDVLVKGADYEAEQIVGREFLESYGGVVVRVPLLPEYSTTRLVMEAADRYRGGGVVKCDAELSARSNGATT